MKKINSVTLSLGLVILLMGILLSACGSTSASVSGPSTSATVVTLDGQALLQQRCSTCHTSEGITQLKGTADQWASLVDSMISRGAQLNSMERQTLIDYLANTNQ